MKQNDHLPRLTELHLKIEQLEAQTEALQAELEEARETLRAIGSGEVDALVVYGDDGERIFTLQGADYPYRVMIESIHEGAATIQLDGTMSYCNRFLAELLERPLEQVLGSSFYNYISAHEKEEFSRLVEAGSRGHARAEFLLTGHSGEVHPVLLTASSAEVDGRRGLCLVVTDLSDQKQALARERELQDSLAKQREDERVRIARDLHDGPLQELIGLSYEVHALISSDDPGQHGEDLKKIFHSLQNQIIELRDVSNELRPDHTIRFGLAKAIRYRIEEMRFRHPELTIRMDLADDGFLIPYDIRSGLFYIFQEAMHNIFRHARASEVEVRLILGDQSILLEVQDNGVGFEPPVHWVDLTRQGHLGLVGMRERAETVGGKLQIFAREHEGTTIQVEVPCDVCSLGTGFGRG